MTYREKVLAKLSDMGLQPDVLTKYSFETIAAGEHYTVGITDCAYQIADDLLSFREVQS